MRIHAKNLHTFGLKGPLCSCNRLYRWKSGEEPSLEKKQHIWHWMSAWECYCRRTFFWQCGQCWVSLCAVAYSSECEWRKMVVSPDQGLGDWSFFFSSFFSWCYANPNLLLSLAMHWCSTMYVQCLFLLWFFFSARSSILCNKLLCLCKSNSQQEERGGKGISYYVCT